MVEISEDFLRKIDNLKEGETLEFAMIYKGPQE